MTKGALWPCPTGSGGGARLTPWLWKGSLPPLRILLEAALAGTAASSLLTGILLSLGAHIGHWYEFPLAVAVIGAYAAVISLFGVGVLGLPVYLALGKLGWAGFLPVGLLGTAAGAAISLVGESDPVFTCICAADGAAAALAARAWIAWRAPRSQSV